MGCAFCSGRESPTCVDRILVFNDGTEPAGESQREPIPYGSEPMFESWIPSMSCPECGVSVGHNHHDGCELEICPQCGDQLTACRCLPGVLSVHDAPPRT